MLYRDLIIDLSKNPLNLRAMPNAEATASGANPLCGDRVRMYAKFTSFCHPEPVEGSPKILKRVQDDNSIVADCSFEGEGCAISMAAASLLTEEAKGKMPEEILQWNILNIFEWLGTELGPSRVKCGLLALETLQQALLRLHNVQQP